MKIEAEISFNGGMSWHGFPRGGVLMLREYVDPEYEKRNPLGGIANVYEVIASRIRAGEAEAVVLKDYNLMRKPK
jgi:hypothetical protein